MSQYLLHSRLRHVAKSSPAERIYRRPGERLGVSPPCPDQASGKTTAESRVGLPAATNGTNTANGRPPLNTCDFPNTEHLKPKTLGEADSEPIGTTSNHPFWSVDRQEFVQAGSLEIGERLQTLSGDVKVVQQKLPRPGPQPVFNLEVHNEHVYFVGQDCVLVHNACDLAEAANARHTKWASNAERIDEVVTRLGERALRHSGGDWRKSEALFEKYLSAVQNRLQRTGNRFAVDIQPATLRDGTRVPGFIQYATRNGWTHQLFHYPGSRRMDAAIVDTLQPVKSYGGSYHKVVYGYGITLNLRKRDISKYYEEVFYAPVRDIR